MLKQLGVGVLCLLLTVSLFGANIAMGVDRGPLDRDHMTSSAEEAELYTHLQGDVIDLLLEQLPPVDLGPLDLELREILEGVVTPEWMQAETERNVGNAYDFLDGSGSLEIYLDSSGLQANAGSAIAETMAGLDFSEVGLERLSDLRNEPDEFEDARSDLRRQIVTSAGYDPEAGYGYDPLARLIADEESYEQERADARDRIAAEAMNELDPAGGFGIEVLEEMLASEESYEREQDSFREARKEEIQEESNRHMSEEELEEAYLERQDDIIDATATVLAEEIDTEEAPPMAEPHVESIALITAEALATDMPHETFSSRYDEAVAEFETDLQSYVHEHPEEFADDLRDTVDAELSALEVPEPLEPAIQDLGDLIVEAITTDLSYAEFSAEYETNAVAIDDAAAGYLWEHEDETDLLLGEAFSGSDTPEPVADALEEYAEAQLAGILTDRSHDEYRTALESRERELGDAVVTYMFESGEGVPDRIELTQEVNEQASNELALVQRAVALLGALVFVLPAISLTLLGGVYLLVRDLATTALALGVGGVLGGGGGFAIATLVPEQVAGELDSLALSDGLIGALDAFVHAVFSPLATQSVLLVAGGTMLTLGGLTLQFDLIDRIRSRGDQAAAEVEDD